MQCAESALKQDLDSQTYDEIENLKRGYLALDDTD